MRSNKVSTLSSNIIDRKSNDDAKIQLESKFENCNIFDNQKKNEDSAQDNVDVQLFEKKHLFKIHNYMGLPFCDFCGNFMWGLLAQGLKCDGMCLFNDSVIKIK